MPPKRKKKSSKLKKMTDEEKVIYLEQQRIINEELKTKKMTLLTQYLQDKLIHEEKFTKLNQAKLIHYWRTIMRETKSKELKKTIEILSQTFERIMDRKESIIKTLVADLSEADEQHLMALRSHLQNVDMLIDLQNQRLHKLKCNYDKELKSLMEEFIKEENYIKEQHEKQVIDLKNIFVALDSTYTAKIHEAIIDQNSLKDDLKNKNLEDKHTLRINLENRVNNLWSEFKQVSMQYTNTTNEKKTFFENLKAKDERSAAEIQLHLNKIQKINENITTTRRRMMKTSKEYEEKNCNLKEERDKLVEKFQILKMHISKFCDLQNEKLINMSLQSEEAIKKVQCLLGKAEKIIKLGEQCRKYETEEEKVIPFYSSSLSVEEENDVHELLEKEQNEEIAKKIKRCLPLEMFWKRFNKVQLDRLALIKEHSMLEQENIQLKLLLKQYLDGISISNEVITSNNSLIVINGRSNLNLNIANDPRIKLMSTDGDDGILPIEVINYATTPGVADYRIRQTT
uniref:Dynein regulatory complex subunit 2 n=1 Tax=Schistosoma japonicum TaxID=6182 RepID=C1LEJ1_SCHJA|nr:Coiled-coil domain-containing protein 65 [Schistosoma japonicum]